MMSISEKGDARLRHVNENLTGSYLGPERISRILKRIEKIADEKPEDADWLLMSLASYCGARAITAWFKDDDLSGLKNWFYAKAKIYFIRKIPPHYNGPVRSALEYACRWPSRHDCLAERDRNCSQAVPHRRCR
jgi:hypothetical protein